MPGVDENNSVAEPRTGPPYSIKDIGKLRELVDEGLTDPKIAELLGCSRLTVGNTRRRNGIRAAKPRRGAA
jgi:Homeodomain-like domain-containing protein